MGNTDYYDFFELNAGRNNPSLPFTFNVNTTRVDAFGLKTVIRLRCATLDQQRGEDYGTFLEDRAITFAKYLAEVPAEFQGTGSLRAPYRIIEPGQGVPTKPIGGPISTRSTPPTASTNA